MPRHYQPKSKPLWPLSAELTAQTGLQLVRRCVSWFGIRWVEQEIMPWYYNYWIQPWWKDECKRNRGPHFMRYCPRRDVCEGCWVFITVNLRPAESYKVSIADVQCAASLNMKCYIEIKRFRDKWNKNCLQKHFIDAAAILQHEVDFANKHAAYHKRTMHAVHTEDLHQPTLPH